MKSNIYQQKQWHCRSAYPFALANSTLEVHFLNFWPTILILQVEKMPGPQSQSVAGLGQLPVGCTCSSLAHLFFNFYVFWGGGGLIRVFLSLVVVREGYTSLQCVDVSLHWLLSFGGTSSSCGAQTSLVVVHGLSCSAECGIFPDQGSNPCPLHWQADS